MKQFILYILILLLLGAEQGWAESRPTLKALIAGEEAPNPLVCLAKMEAAMRAMEPFLGGTVRFSSSTLGEYWIERKMTAGKPELKELLKAQELWDAAKQACWREKP